MLKIDIFVESKMDQVFNIEKKIKQILKRSIKSEKIFIKKILKLQFYSLVPKDEIPKF